MISKNLYNFRLKEHQIHKKYLECPLIIPPHVVQTKVNWKASCTDYGQLKDELYRLRSIGRRVVQTSVNWKTSCTDYSQLKGELYRLRSIGRRVVQTTVNWKTSCTDYGQLEDELYRLRAIGRRVLTSSVQRTYVLFILIFNI